MEPPTGNAARLVEMSRHFARQLLTIGENRFELLMVEVQEEQERLLGAILLSLGVAGFGLLAGLALTGAIVVLFWEFSRVAALLLLTGLYGATAVCFWWGLTLLLHNWQNLPAILDQLRKDRACLEQYLT